MAKIIHTDSFLTGTGDKVRPAKSFIYELSIYKIYKDRVELIESKYYSSENRLSLRKVDKIIKGKNYSLGVYIDWIGAPVEYIKNNNLKLISKKK